MNTKANTALMAVLPNGERPREKMLKRGASCLTDTELLAILLGSGGRGCNVLQLAASILPLIDQKNGKLQPEDLLAVRGLGTAKACLIGAAYEFARRRIRPYGVKISQACDIMPLVGHLAGRLQEHFVSISLNGANEVIACRVLTIGLVNATQIHPREVYSECITDRASSIIVAHNHPSGNLMPSEEDKKTTMRLKTSGDILGVPLLDHIIFATTGFYSFREQGLL